MVELETRQLRYFVAVAEELHFGRAAARLGIARPPLSRAVRALERQLGVQLLERTTRRVLLTPAGSVLLDEARTSLEAVSAAADRTRHAGSREPVLRVALKADHDFGLLPAVVAAFHADPAAVEVALVLGGRGEQAPALRHGRADVALVLTPFDRRGLEVDPLLTEPRVAALSVHDPLASRGTLRLDDLRGHRLPDGSPAQDVDRGEQGPGAGAPAAPRLDLAQLLSLVELGQVVWFPPVSIATRHTRPGVAYRPVEDIAPTTLMAAWPVGSRSAPVAAFVRACQQVASAHERAEARPA